MAAENPFKKNISAGYSVDREGIAPVDLRAVNHAPFILAVDVGNRRKNLRTADICTESRRTRSNRFDSFDPLQIPTIINGE